MVQQIHIHPLEMNKWLKETDISEGIIKKKNTVIQKDPPNKPQIVPPGTESMPQNIPKHRIATVHWSAQPQREQDEREKSSYGVDR